MRLSQPRQNLLKAVILADVIIIILVLLMLVQFFSYYVMASSLEQKQQLSLSPSHSSSSSSSAITKDMLPQKGNKNTMMTKLIAKSKINIGAWDPYQMPLEELHGRKQEKAIKALLEQGFSEYYFVMNDFNDLKAKRAIENLLKSADKTHLKILIILLPPSEGGPDGNYDWDGWIDHFNDLKDKHRSFKGFTIDDFNWISTRNDTRFWKNIDYMKYSNLSKALYEKRDGVILATTCYYNITNLEKDLLTFARIFDNEPIRYVVYPTITYNYSRLNYNPPSDRLLMATLSIVTKVADGILIWRDIDSHVVEDYLSNHDDQKYLSKISKIEKLQIRDEIIWRKENPTLANSALFQGHCHI